MSDAPLAYLLGFLVFLICLSAFFSGSETGMMALNRYRLKHLRNTNRGAQLADDLLKRPDRLIGLILIGNNAVNILASAIATIIAIRLWGEAGIFIATALLTLIILVFSEVTPKTLAALHPEKVAFPASYLLKGLLTVLYPVVWSVNLITNTLLRLLGVNPHEASIDELGSDELRTIVGEAGPHIPKRHQRMLLNILDLEKVTVEDIMIPRNDIYGIDLADDDEEIIQQLRNSELTRIILYQEDINNVLGFLHMRLTSRFLNEDKLNREAMIAAVEKPYFVPESTPLNKQLLNFQNTKQRIALVVDEYGSVLGLTTLEDILEEIVGEFTSTLADQKTEICTLEQEGCYQIDGTATIRDINKTLHWELPVDGPKTLNGLILEHLESFPDANACIRIDDYIFEITHRQGTQIETVKATRRQ